MTSQTRLDCEQAILNFKSHISSNGCGIYVGIAGDPKGGEYAKYFNHKFITVDADSRWGPDIVCDITSEAFTKLKIHNPSLIICVQVIEHVKDIFCLPDIFADTLIDGGYLIIDCPWMFPYHAEPPSFGDYWRVSKDGLEYLFSRRFDIISTHYTNNNNSILLRKK